MGVVPKRAVVLSGSLGLGHDAVARSSVGALELAGFEVRVLDSMTLLGRFAGQIGEAVFRRLMSRTTIYDGLHFSHLRPGSRVTAGLDRVATSRLVPALRQELSERPAELVLSVFATGASAAAKLRSDFPSLHTVVLCTDAVVHRLWIGEGGEGTELFLVTSEAAAASVRRFLPRAQVAVVPAPVRPEFYSVPARQEARRAFDVPEDAGCVLLMGGGWGLGPLDAAAGALASAGVHVLAVAGRNEALERRLSALAATAPLVHPFGFTEAIPHLMAACDLVITTPGATTCSEARVVGRQLMLLDVVPGHGRDNLQHELETGGAEVCDGDPSLLSASVLAALERTTATGNQPSPRGAERAGEWELAFTEALVRAGAVLLAHVTPCETVETGRVPGAPTPVKVKPPHDANALPPPTLL